MNSEHIQTGTLKAYLLRTLSDKEAEAIEERYFTDASFFKQLRAAEMELICDYLDGQLNESECEQFEGRYLHVHTLRKLVEEVRERRSAVRRAARRRVLQIALAGAIGCVAIMSIEIFRHNRFKTVPAPVQSASIEPPSTGIYLTLTPGTSKGPREPLSELALPGLPQPVSLVAKLPGQVFSATYMVRLLNVDLEGPRKNVWTANGIPSTSRTGGQQVIVKLPSSSIAPGDYILELEMEGGHVRETYSFRVTPSRKE